MKRRITTLVGKKPALLESAEQSSVIAWFFLQHPELSDLLVHIPNGQNVGTATGARLKRMGLRAGFPDLFLYVPRGTWHGMAIEMKTTTGRPSVLQLKYQKLLTEQGYLSAVCYGFDDARELINKYLNLQR